MRAHCCWCGSLRKLHAALCLRLHKRLCTVYTLAEAAACTAPPAAVGSKRASSDLEDTLDAAVVSSSPLLRRATANRGFRVGFRGRWGGAPVGRAVRQVQGRIWREGWS